MKMQSGIPRKTPGMRRVWRITATAPLGEFVDEVVQAPGVKPRTPGKLEADVDEAVDKTWRASSFELAQGAEVDDVSDSMPGDLFDELFGPETKPPPDKPGR